MTRFTDDLTAGQCLGELFEKIEIKPDATPLSVWDAHPEFKKIKLANFHAKVNKMRREFGLKNYTK